MRQQGILRPASRGSLSVSSVTLPVKTSFVREVAAGAGRGEGITGTEGWGEVWGCFVCGSSQGSLRFVFCLSLCCWVALCCQMLGTWLLGVPEYLARVPSEP